MPLTVNEWNSYYIAAATPAVSGIHWEVVVWTFTPWSQAIWNAGFINDNIAGITATLAKRVCRASTATEAVGMTRTTDLSWVGVRRARTFSFTFQTNMNVSTCIALITALHKHISADNNHSWEKFHLVELNILIQNSSKQPKSSLLLTFRPLSEAFIRRSWY